MAWIWEWIGENIGGFRGDRGWGEYDTDMWSWVKWCLYCLLLGKKNKEQKCKNLTSPVAPVSLQDYMLARNWAGDLKTHRKTQRVRDADMGSSLVQECQMSPWQTLLCSGAAYIEILSHTQLLASVNSRLISVHQGLVLRAAAGKESQGVRDL